MSLAVWIPSIHGAPQLAGYSHSDARTMLAVRLTGEYEQRARRSPRRFRSYRLTIRADATQRAAADAFFVARGYEAESFLFEDDSDHVGDAGRYAKGVAMGTAIAAQVAFVIPTAGDVGGYYPRDVAATVLYGNGAAVAKTVTTDSRTLTANSAPGAGVVMTADVWFYRRVRLDGPYSWSPVGDPGVWEASMSWLEVPA